MHARALLVFLACAAYVFAHGYVALISIDGALYHGNAPGQNTTSSPILTLSADGPVQNVSSEDLVCGIGATSEAQLIAEAQPGSNVTFAWVSGSDGPWPHIAGPILTYMAYVPDGDGCNSLGCEGFTTGPEHTQWFKIAEVGVNANGTGWVQAVFAQGGNYTVQLPENLSPGQYFLRNELIALQNAMAPGGAEFYPSCTQLRVVGNGTLVPAPHSTVTFPGAYNASDPGILVNVYDSPNAAASYVFPGPPIALLVPDSSEDTSEADEVTTTPSASSTTRPPPPPLSEIVPAPTPESDMMVLVVPGQGAYLQRRLDL